MSSIKAFGALSEGAPPQPFEYTPGPLRPEPVEIAVGHCGICHSDLSMIDNEWDSSAFPLVTIADILEFCARHDIAPVTEIFPLSRVNDALEHLRAGKARYRIVLENDLATSS